MQHYKFNNYTVAADDFKAAKWQEIDSGNFTTYTTNDYTHTIIAVPTTDEVWWDGIEAKDVPATDADGKPCKISISLDVCTDESSHIFVNVTEEVGHAEDDDGEDYYAYALAQLAGHEIGGKMCLDYEDAADDFIRDNPNVRYIMDDRRGFANEWCLYICKSDEEAGSVMARFRNHTEYNAEDVRPWLISAMQTGQDYKAHHAAEKCCSAMWAEDIDLA